MSEPVPDDADIVLTGGEGKRILPPIAMPDERHRHKVINPDTW